MSPHSRRLTHSLTAAAEQKKRPPAIVPAHELSILLALSEAADKQQGLLNCQTALSHAMYRRTLNSSNYSKRRRLMICDHDKYSTTSLSRDNNNIGNGEYQ
jgi:hypothetical protein